MSHTAPLTTQRFHTGERAVQARLGIEAQMAEIGQRVIRDHLPEQHRLFFGNLPFVMVGSLDERARPWASIMVGEPGFLHSSDPGHLAVAARTVKGDPLQHNLQVGAPLGFLGIELSTRRRNRMNGRVTATHPNGFEVHVDQTMGNCPQYIRQRDLTAVRDLNDMRPRTREELTVLDPEAVLQIGQSDTLFVASHAPGDAASMAHGSDVSHRGGPAGFVRIEDDHTLLVPDFRGNKVFMTLGNFMAHPRAGLLFIDFARGDLLTLTGRVEIVWEGAELARIAGAERAWRFHLDAGWRLRDALPLRWAPL